VNLPDDAADAATASDRSTVQMVLLDCFARVSEEVHAVLRDIDPDLLIRRPGEGANTIAWLVWHLARIQDDQVADLADVERVWTSQQWDARFGLPFDRSETGYGMSTADVAKVQASSELLLGYHNAVHERSLQYVRTVDDTELARIVDTAWNPPVTALVRLVSIVSDCLQHVGQAEYARGLMAEFALDE
jgi:uncharacterized damage-inducible protein DinB